MDPERERFEELVRRCQAAVCAVAYARVRDRGHSEEIAQEAFLVAWLRRADTTPSVAWICGIARNLARNARRRPKEVPMSVEPSGRDPRDELIERERTGQAVAALAELHDREREAVVLYYRGDESHAAVAEALGITEAAARQRVHRARAKLREALATVEHTLRRSKPSAAFTAAVVAAWLARGRDAAAATAGAAMAARGATATTAGSFVLFGGIAAGSLAVIGTIVATATGAFGASQRSASLGGVARNRLGASAQPLAVDDRGGAPPRAAIAAPAPPALPQPRTMDLDVVNIPIEDLLAICGEAAGVPIEVDASVPSSVSDFRGSGVDPIAILDQTLASIHARREVVEGIQLVTFGGRSDATALGGDPVTIHLTESPIGNALRMLARPLHMPIGADDFADEAVVSIDVDNVPAGVALEKLLSQTHLGYEFASGYRIVHDPE